MTLEEINASENLAATVARSCYVDAVVRLSGHIADYDLRREQQTCLAMIDFLELRDIVAAAGKTESDLVFDTYVYMRDCHAFPDRTPDDWADVFDRRAATERMPPWHNRPS